MQLRVQVRTRRPKFPEKYERRLRPDGGFQSLLENMQGFPRNHSVQNIQAKVVTSLRAREKKERNLNKMSALV